MAIPTCPLSKRDQQRRGLVAGRLGDVRAAIEQQPRHFGIAVANRKQQRRHAAVGCRQGALPDDAVAGGATGAGGHVLSFRHRDVGVGIDVGAAREKQLDHVGVIFEHGPHERGLRVHGVLRVDVRAAIEKQGDGIDLAGARRGHESGFAAGVGGVRIGAGIEEPADHGRISVQSPRGPSG